MVFLLLALSGGGEILSAQRALGRVGQGIFGLGPRLGENVALALDLQRELDLSTQQIEALEALGAEMETHLGPLEDELDFLREEMMNAEVGWSEGTLRLRESLAHYQEAAEPFRNGVADILSEEQHLLLQAAMFDTRPVYGRGLGRGVAGAPGAGLGLGYVGARGLRYGRGAGYGVRGGLAVGFGRGAGYAGRGFRRNLPRRGLGFRWR
jgi:hypothetical protein